MKNLDASVNFVKMCCIQIEHIIYNIETFTRYYFSFRPNMMEHFGVLSSQLNSVKRLLKTSKMPLLRNYVLFPILLSPDRDLHLEVIFKTYAPILSVGLRSLLIDKVTNWPLSNHEYANSPQQFPFRILSKI